MGIAQLIVFGGGRDIIHGSCIVVVEIAYVVQMGATTTCCYLAVASGVGSRMRVSGGIAVVGIERSEVIGGVGQVFQVRKLHWGELDPELRQALGQDLNRP